jgi:hypothetical protein
MSQEQPTDTPRHLPRFQNREELAEFWDTHRFTSYLDDLEPAQTRRKESKEQVVEESFEQRFDRLCAEIKATQAEMKDLLNLLVEKLVKSGRIQP